MSIVHVLICDPKEPVRQVIRERLSNVKRIVITGEVEHPEQVIEGIEREKPLSVIFPMPSETFEGIEAFRREDDANANVNILAISCRRDFQALANRVRQGIGGYRPLAPKDIQLALAMTAFADHHHLFWHDDLEFVHHSTGHPKIAPISSLTEKQIEIMKLLVSGLSVKEVASRLGVSTQAIDKHKVAIMQKLGVGSIAQLATMAVKLGMIPFC